MSSKSRLDSYFEYGRKLADSGAQGIRSGSQSYLHGQPLSASLSESACDSLPFAAIGIAAAVIRLVAGSRRHRISRSLAAGFTGAMVGFVAGFTFKSRHLAGSMAKDALTNIGKTRDAHWLEHHPITYA
jgi:hypothetical protein